jgi:hypothetical protein
MEAVAGSDLSNLHGQLVRETMQLPFQFRTFPNYTHQHLNATTVGGSVGLDHNSGGTGAISNQQGQTDEAFLPDKADFYGFSVRLNRQN